MLNVEDGYSIDAVSAGDLRVVSFVFSDCDYVLFCETGVSTPLTAIANSERNLVGFVFCLRNPAQVFESVVVAYCVLMCALVAR